ncbi:MAG TPA: hypothetical protein VG269_21660 [Tepidisphaeraceae bacterium]|nr:hypothetical protein [Tepidisphaeraceae bacterium]
MPGEVSGVPNFARVSNLLYRGAQPSQQGFQTLHRMGIRAVLDLRGKIHRDACESFGLKGLQIPSNAAHPDERQIIEFLRMAQDPANQPLFIHDDHGSLRTGCYVAAYRMVEQGWTAQDAEVEMRCFGFDPFWKAIPSFLENLKVARIREELQHPPQTEPAATLPANDAD